MGSPGRVQATRDPGLARSLDRLSNTPGDSFAEPQDSQLFSLSMRTARRGPESSDEVGRATQLKGAEDKANWPSPKAAERGSALNRRVWNDARDGGLALIAQPRPRNEWLGCRGPSFTQ